MLFPFCSAPAAKPRRSGNNFSALGTQVAADHCGPEAGDHRRGIADRSAGPECIDALCHCNENAAERDNRTRPIAGRQPTLDRNEPWSRRTPPGNLTIVAPLGVCPLSVAGAIFPILELALPFAGVIRVLSAPLHGALAHLGQ